MGFETKNCHFYVLFIWTVTIAILHQKFVKVIKTTKNVSKTVDNEVWKPNLDADHFVKKSYVSWAYISVGLPLSKLECLRNDVQVQ